MSSELSPRPTPETHPDILQMHTVSATNNSTRFDSIKTQEEFVRKATEESKRLQQEIVDSEAESIMPPD